MDRRLNRMGNETEETIKRRYNQYGRIYVDVADFLKYEFVHSHKREFPTEVAGGLERTFSFTLLKRTQEYAVFKVTMKTLNRQHTSLYEATVYLSTEPWENMEEVLGPTPFTVQLEGPSNALKQLNPGTYAFDKFFGLCHCEALIH